MNSFNITANDINKARIQFKQSAYNANHVIKKDNLNISKNKKSNGIIRDTLNFSNFTSTLNEYINCDSTDIFTLKELIKDLSLWSLYFGELEAYISEYKNSKNNKMLYYSGFPKIPENLKVINELSEDIKCLTIFIKNLKIEKKLLSTLSNHCLYLYNEALSTYIYRY